MEIRKSALDDPQIAAIAWARFYAILRWMTGIALIASALGVWIMEVSVGDVGWVLRIMVFIGVFVAVMLMAALMGLVFMSHGTGHDEAVVDPFEEDA